MVFSTLVFIFMFFPLVVISYFLCQNRTYRNILLLFFSLLFYAWGEPKYIILMLAASLVAYAGGLLIERFREVPKVCRITFIIVLALLIGNLFVFKYLNFFADNLNLLMPNAFVIHKIALPIGISFYTFQILSYVIDLYQGQIQVQKNYFYLTLYVSFFPQLIAGPIVRYSTIEEEIQKRKESVEDVAQGLRRFLLGLAKKVILANNVGYIAATVYEGDPQSMGTLFYWIAALAYALQIYFDFSGYSDMAIGMGRIFGFHFLENFNYPYISLSVTDFWRRWHISLSSWFRDYVYIPLGGNRCSKSRWLLNICIVWMLTGLWHGAQWNFVLWGVYYAVLLILEKVFLNKYLFRLPKAVQWLYSFILVLIGWVIFNANSLEQIGKTLSMMFGFVPTDLISVLAKDATICRGLIYIPLGVLCMLPWKNKIQIADSAAGEMFRNGCCLMLFLLCLIYIFSAAYNPFIYFRF